MRPADYFGASPKTVLNKPFFHAQDQKAYNVDGGSSIADAWTKRDLNTVIANDIQGASLASNAVNLPAGTYYVEGEFTVYGANNSSCIAAIFKDGTKQLQSISPVPFAGGYGGCGNTVRASGLITLAIPGVVDLRYYFGTVVSNGLGINNNSNSITDPAINSIYADLKIWQLDRSLEIAPVAVNSGLQNIAGVNTQDNIDGLDITTSGQVITVTKGSCMNSDRSIVMALTANATWTVASTNNLETYLFLVRLVADGTFTVKGYSTYAGPSSDVLVDKWRFISWAKNNGSGVLMPYRQVGSRIDWLTSNRPVLTASITASYAPYSVSSILPISVISETTLIGNTPAVQFYPSYDGVTDIAGYYPGIVSILPVSSIYLKSGTSQAMHFTSITLRR